MRCNGHDVVKTLNCCALCWVRRFSSVAEQFIQQQDETTKRHCCWRICMRENWEYSLERSYSRGLCTINIKIPLGIKGGRFCEENFLRYLDLCYVNPTYHKSKTFESLYYRLWTEQKLQEIVFAKSAALVVKGILLPLVQCT